MSHTGRKACHKSCMLDIGDATSHDKGYFLIDLDWSVDMSTGESATDEASAKTGSMRSNHEALSTKSGSFQGMIEGWIDDASQIIVDITEHSINASESPEGGIVVGTESEIESGFVGIGVCSLAIKHIDDATIERRRSETSHRMARLQKGQREIHLLKVLNIDIEIIEELHSLGEIIFHDNILFDERHDLAKLSKHLLDIGRRLERTAKLEALSGVDELDSGDMVEVVDDLMELGSGISAHRHEVFLAVRANDRIARSGPSIHLVLAHHRSSGILRDHEAGVKAGMGHEELGETSKSEDKLGGATFGDITEFTKSHAHIVESESEGLAMEITAGYDKVFVGEYGGIVGDGIDLCVEDVSDMDHSIFDSAMHLRDAAERIWILHMFFMTSDDLAALEEIAEDFGGG